MKRIKKSLKDQGILFPTGYICDKLENSDEVYQFDKLLDKLEIESVTGSYKSEGGSLINPRDHLAVILYAYFQGIQSSKKISKLTRTNVEFMYLAGGHHIKSRTIRAFRVRNKESMKDIFKSSVDLAIDIGLVNASDIFALDGSKFASNASFSKSRKKKDWEKRQQKIINSIDDFFDEWEKQDDLDEKNEEEQKNKIDEVKKKLEKIKDHSYKKASEKKRNKNTEQREEKPKEQGKKIDIQDLEKVEKLLTEHESIDELLDTHKEVKDESYLNIVEPESHPMKSHDTIIEAYNAQAITNNQVIVANEITENENDQHDLALMVNQLMTIIDKLLNNSPQRVPKLIKFLADAGYNMGSNLSFLDKLTIIDAYISMNDRSKTKEDPKSKFLKDKFDFDEEEDNWICPSGKNLDFMKEHISHGKKHTLYGCNKETCLVCNDYDLCVTTKNDKKRGFRTIDDDMFTIFRNEMRNKMENETSKEIYAKRSPEIEGVFGQIKNNRGIRRFILRGLEKVKAEFNMIALTHNMGKIMKYMNQKPELWNACTN